jgi:D-alanyl-D-alanine carboxypeptidase
MNDWAQRTGMTHSRFANPIGSDDPAGHEASARDMVRATRVLLNDWLLARIVRTRTATVEIAGPNARSMELTATNQLLERDDVFGIKTGTDEVAGQCLITGFWRGDNQIITVVLGSPDRYADTLILMEHIDARYRWVALGAGTRSVGATESLATQGLTFMVRRTVMMTAEQADRLSWELLPSAAPGGSRRGVVVFSIGAREIARFPVYSATTGDVPARRTA